HVPIVLGAEQGLEERLEHASQDSRGVKRGVPADARASSRPGSETAAFPPRRAGRRSWTVDGSGDAGDLRRFGPPLAGPDLALDPVTFVQPAESPALDRGVVDEEFLQGLRCDETVTLLIVEPLHGATHHVRLPPRTKRVPRLRAGTSDVRKASARNAASHPRRRFRPGRTAVK